MESLPPEIALFILKFAGLFRAEALTVSFCVEIQFG
jgi:hypothetical protein